MPGFSHLNSALAGFRRAADSGRIAHAWLLIGPPRAAAAAMAEDILRMLLCRSSSAPCGTCPACRQVSGRTHADVLWVEPESKSRQVRIEQVRSRILPFIGLTSYSGGWKACVILCADRLNEASQNALLMTLEEPPPRSLLLLVTENPQALLPTIISRCQTLRAAGAAAGLAPEIRERILDVLSGPPASSSVERLGRALVLSDLLREIRDETEASLPEEEGGDAKEKEIQEARIRAAVLERQLEILRALSNWQRDLLAITLGADPAGLLEPSRAESLRREAARLDPVAALRRIECVETLHRRLERNLPAEWAFESCFRELDEVGKPMTSIGGKR